MSLLVNIDVDDLEAAVRFYCAAVGLTVGRRLGEDAVELLGSSAPLYLLARAPGTPATPGSGQRRSFDRHWTPVHLDFVVEDIAVAVAGAVAAGARLEEAETTHAWGRLALLSDPFGHGFCFVEFIGRGYDEITG